MKHDNVGRVSGREEQLGNKEDITVQCHLKLNCLVDLYLGIVFQPSIWAKVPPVSRRETNVTPVLIKIRILGLPEEEEWKLPV